MAYVPLLWKFSVPLTGDQKTYLAVAMEMRQKSEWLIPRLFGEPCYLKPPFQYWMTLLGWKVFGFSLFGAFFPSVLAVVVTAYFLSEISGLLGERRWYVSSGLWFAATIGAMTYGLSAQMDIYLCAFYASAWWAAFRFLSEPDESREPRWLYLAFFLAGMLSLVKSPLYSVLWTLGFVSYLLFNGEWLMLKNRHLYLSWFAGIAFAALWYAYVGTVDGDHFWAQYFVQEQFDKRGGNGGTLASLWLPLLYMAAPLTLLVVTALRSVVLGRRTTAIARFVACWCWPPALFFSAYPYRTSLYLFLLVPALAVLVDWGCFRAGRTRTFLWTSRITGGMLFLALGGAGFLLFRAELVPVWLSVALPFVGLGLAAIAWFGYARTLAIGTLVSVLFIRIALVGIMQPDAERLKEALGDDIARAAMLDESRDIWHEIGLYSLVIGHPMERLYGYDDVMEFLERGGAIVLSDQDYGKYEQTVAEALKPKGLVLRTSPWRRFQRRKKIPVGRLLLHGKDSIPEWEQTLTREFHVVRASAG